MAPWSLEGVQLHYAQDLEGITFPYSQMKKFEIHLMFHFQHFFVSLQDDKLRNR